MLKSFEVPKKFQVRQEEFSNSATATRYFEHLVHRIEISKREVGVDAVSEDEVKINDCMSHPAQKDDEEVEEEKEEEEKEEEEKEEEEEEEASGRDTGNDVTLGGGTETVITEQDNTNASSAKTYWAYFS